MDRIQTLTNRENHTTPVIVSIGQTTIDTVLIDGKPPSVHIGGSAYMPARIWAGSGTRVGMVSCLGADLEPSALRADNLDMRGTIRVPGPSTSVELHYSGQQLVGLRVVPGASDKLDISQIPADYLYASLFYISPAPLRFLLELTELAADRRIPVAFSPKEDFPSIENEEMRRILSRCKFCFVNEKELKLVTNVPHPAEAMKILHNAGPACVIVTKGMRGVTISSVDGDLFEMPVSAVVAVDNPVGAGDCFAAIFLSTAISGHSARDSAMRAIVYTEKWLRNRHEQSVFEEKYQ
jgi:sugar/nucleoside kinase (ribokinase family)